MPPRCMRYGFGCLLPSLAPSTPLRDALWLEDGLSRTRSAAYRRDLTLYAGSGWPTNARRWRWTTRPNTTCRPTLPPPRADARHLGQPAPTVLPLLSLGAARAAITTDPTLRLQAATPVSLRVPKTLSQAQVGRC